MSQPPKAPLVIELEPEDLAPGPLGSPMGPAEAPLIDDAGAPLPQGRAMQMAARLAARPSSRLARFFWQSAGAAFSFFLGLAAWNALTALIAAHPVLGYIGTGLTLAFLLAALLVIGRELRAWARMARLDKVHRAVMQAAAGSDRKAADAVVDQLLALYGKREDMRWATNRLSERRAEAFDPDTLLLLTETELMAPLDTAARAEVEAAARTVATVTALVPLALADVVAALTANLRMIRRLAEIYGGRAGTFGSWRLARTVLTHLVATGAVAAGDDLLETMAGGGILSKLSRRFGEGVVNGALTARVGIAAMEVCRPMPFVALPKPRVTNLVGRALTGLFGRDKA